MTDRVDRLVFAPVLVLVIIALTIFMANTVPDPNITWDEAGQFWMSQGAGYGTSWNQPDEGLLAGLEYGRVGNILDPVGFTALLAGWVEVFGPQPATLRTLPFLFFIGTIAVSFYLGRRTLQLPRTLSLILPLAILTTYVTSQWATEVRNYSMELFGLLASVVLMLRYLERPSWWRLGGLGATLAFFSIASRYSFSLTAAACALVILAVLWRSSSFRDHTRHLIALALTLTVTAIFLIWNIGLLRGERVWSSYVDNSIRLDSITDFNSLRMRFQVNFIYGWNKLTLLFIVSGLVAFWLIHRLRRSGLHTSPAPTSPNDQWLPLWLFVVLYEVLRGIANQLGGPMWNAEHRHGIALISIAIISGLAFSAMMRDLVTGGLGRYAASRRSAHSRALLVTTQSGLWIVLVALTWLAVQHFAEFRRDQEDTLAYTVPTTVASSISKEDSVRWRVEAQLYPSFRYLIKKSGVPLGNFSITTAEPFSTYGHDQQKFLTAMKTSDLCKVGTTTAVIAAESAEFNKSSFDEFTEHVGAEGCEVEVVPLSERESLLLVRER